MRSAPPDVGRSATPLRALATLAAFIVAVTPASAMAQASPSDLTIRAPRRPADATARCADGSYSLSVRRNLACTGHGGIAEWYGLPVEPAAPPRTDTVLVTRVDTVTRVRSDTVHVVRLDTVNLDYAANRAREDWVARRVFYVTDRAKSGSWRSGAVGLTEPLYGSERAAGGALSFGSVMVSIPRTHEIGTVERRLFYTRWDAPEPAKYMEILSVATGTQATFLAGVRQFVASSSRKEALVFIHGFNVSFRDAALRTAQLGVDLQFDGPVVAYSWPSRASLAHYTVDRNEAERTGPNLRAFLDSLSQATGARRVHIITHSTGGLALGRALAIQPATGNAFNQIVLAAPDIDADVFRTQILPLFRARATRTTLYASANDLALAAARFIVGGAQRAGEIAPRPVLVDGLDTIDATAAATDLLGHSAVFQNRALIDDLFHLVSRGKAPADRNLRPYQVDGRRLWIVP